MKLKQYLLLRLFGIKPKSTKSDLPKKLIPIINRTTEDFNNWSTQLFINNHRN